MGKVLEWLGIRTNRCEMFGHWYLWYGVDGAVKCKHCQKVSYDPRDYPLEHHYDY